MECLGVNIKEKKKKTMWLWQTFRTWANQSLLCCTALGSGYLRDKLRGRKLTPPRFGKHSACPPTVGRSLLWSLLHHPWQDPERYMKGTKSFKGVDDQYGKPNISCHMRNKCVPWTSWSWSCTGSPPCFPWWWPRWFCCHSELWTPPHVGPCHKTLSCLRGCQQFCRRGKT